MFDSDYGEFNVIFGSIVKKHDKQSGKNTLSKKHFFITQDYDCNSRSLVSHQYQY